MACSVCTHSVIVFVKTTGSLIFVCLPEIKRLKSIVEYFNLNIKVKRMMFNATSNTGCTMRSPQQRYPYIHIFIIKPERLIHNQYFSSAMKMKITQYTSKTNISSLFDGLDVTFFCVECHFQYYYSSIISAGLISNGRNPKHCLCNWHAESHTVRWSAPRYLHDTK